MMILFVTLWTPKNAAICANTVRANLSNPRARIIGRYTRLPETRLKPAVTTQKAEEDYAIPISPVFGTQIIATTSIAQKPIDADIISRWTFSDK